MPLQSLRACSPLLSLAGELIGVEYLLSQTQRGDLLRPVQSDDGDTLPEFIVDLLEEDVTDMMPQVVNMLFTITTDNSKDMVYLLFTRLNSKIVQEVHI